MRLRDLLPARQEFRPPSISARQLIVLTRQGYFSTHRAIDELRPEAQRQLEQFQYLPQRSEIGKLLSAMRAICPCRNPAVELGMRFADRYQLLSASANPYLTAMDDTMFFIGAWQRAADYLGSRHPTAALGRFWSYVGLTLIGETGEATVGLRQLSRRSPTIQRRIVRLLSSANDPRSLAYDTEIAQVLSASLPAHA